MRNTIHTPALISAVLISVAIQALLLWHFNDVAADNQVQAAASATRAAPLALRQITLAPVVVVGKRELLAEEPTTALASVRTPATQTPRERTLGDAPTL